MSTTTSGQISVTPVRIKTTATLEELAQALVEVRYSGKQGTRGWGSVKDGTDELLGQVTRERPRGGKPEPVLRSEDYPDQVRARLYWDEPDKALERAFGIGADALTTTRFRAADITFAAGVDDGELIALLGERNDSRLRNYVIPGVNDLLELVDDSAMILQDSNDLEFGDDDFFRWILYRATHDPVLNDDLEVLAVRSMSNQDMAYRPTNMTKGVELDRPELLALLAGTLNKFGPAKVVIWSAALSLRVYFEATANGQFSVYRGQSEYDLEPGEYLSHEEAGLRLLQDVAFEILPELKRAHNNDKEWRDTNRDAFIQEARNLLKSILAKL